ncbi:MAG TPA: hypothetical protein VNF71_08480 [Acidimicrobiales bacterium]|nr:hypothetical protein [Acidimicrobiales bacterium]
MPSELGERGSSAAELAPPEVVDANPAWRQDVGTTATTDPEATIDDLECVTRGNASGSGRSVPVATELLTGS